MSLLKRAVRTSWYGGLVAYVAVAEGCGAVAPSSKDSDAGGGAAGTGGDASAIADVLQDASLGHESDSAIGDARDRESAWRDSAIEDGSPPSADGANVDANPVPFDVRQPEMDVRQVSSDGAADAAKADAKAQDATVTDARADAGSSACGKAGQPCCSGGACSIPNASATCSSGVCVFGICNTGFDDCNHDAADGCEVDLENDSNHCDRCGTPCKSGTACRHATCDAKYVPLPPPPALGNCTNVALGATVTSSAATESAKNLVDGDRSTGWNAGAGPSQSVTITLKTPTRVSGLTLAPDFVPGGQFAVRTSADSTVVDDREATFIEGTTDTVGFVFASPTTAATQFRIEEYAGPSWVAFREIALWKCP